MKVKNSINEPLSLIGDELPTNLSYNPMQREINQMKTSSQVQQYESAKMLSAQGRTEMRGNVPGYADKLA